MEEKIETIKKSYHINEVFPIEPITLERKKVYLFYGKKQEISYSLCTDGNVEHLDTWADKRPQDLDSFLTGCQIESGRWIDRFELQITDANVLLIEKKYKDKTVRNLYINQEHLDKVIQEDLYQISISSNERLMIKKLGEQ